MPPGSQLHYAMNALCVGAVPRIAWHGLLGKQRGLFWLVDLEVEVEDWAASLVWASLRGSTVLGGGSWRLMGG